MTTTLGLILAGGQARRMGGGDKALLRVGGSTILDRTLERFAPQCVDTIINANGDPKRFDFTGLTIVPDDVPGSAGPLAGILAGLDWCATHRPEIEFVASVSGDCPFLPTDLVQRLHAVRETENKPLACARSGEWRHPTIALWRVDLRGDLRHALVDDDLRKIEVWTARHGVAIASWPDKPTDPFFNVNTPEDLRAAEALIGE